MKRVGLRLDPLDVLFFRDGRPFGAAEQAASTLPMPQVLAGALRTALIEQHGGVADSAAVLKRHDWILTLHVRGPWLARAGSDGQIDDVYVPAPATLHVEKSPDTAAEPRHVLLQPLRPGRLPGWPDGALRPIWLKAKLRSQRETRYLGRAGLQAFLKGQTPDKSHLVDEDALVQRDRRTGIGVHPDLLSADEGLIYSASFLALAKGICFYAEVLLPDGTSLNGIDTVAFGGEGRRARLTVLSAPFAWPRAVPAGGKEKPLLLLTTPGLFDNPEAPWRPRRLAPLAAAAVPGGVAVSGWDLAVGGPKPTRFAAAAGSVYFLDGPAPAAELQSLCDRPDDARLGYGCYLEGVWTDD